MNVAVTCADARYFGHVVMSSPSRSSTTHLIFESILQGKGWDAGWSLILRMAGNAAKDGSSLVVHIPL